MNEKIKNLTSKELEYRIKDNQLQRESLNITALSDVNKFGSEQFDLLELQRDLMETGNALIERQNEILSIDSDYVRVEFIHGKKEVLHNKMKNTEIAKIPINDFLIIDNITYVPFTKTYNLNDDIVYVVMETIEEFNKRYD